jgi:hypothetical protein
MLKISDQEWIELARYVARETNFVKDETAEWIQKDACLQFLLRTRSTDLEETENISSKIAWKKLKRHIE